MKTLIFILSLNITQMAFSNEPKLHLLNVPKTKIQKIAKEDLAAFEINNNEMVQLYGIKTEKKQKSLAKN